MMNKAKALYLHVPFCEHICAYCDFSRCKYHQKLSEKWLVQITKEIEQTLEKDTLTTIYIGGGTPTALSHQQLEILLKSLNPYREKVSEYTVEVNPETLDEKKAQILFNYGVNRISLGVQSFQDELLEIMNRKHRFNDIELSLNLLNQVGIFNISIDLMYALPRQTLTMWLEDLNKALQLPITHISIYSLTIEKHSTFGRKYLKAIDNEIEAIMYEKAIEVLENHNFYHYEVSNFAKHNYESKHNKVYWYYDDFIGLGCGASGKENHIRYESPFQIDVFVCGTLNRINTVLTKEDEMFEYLMMNLRLFEGCDKKRFMNRFQYDIDEMFGSLIQQQVQLQTMWDTKDKFGFTHKGMILMNEVLIQFMEILEKED